ncbi:MAG: hypothetical protein Q9172_002151 [Xanthocarpia lactea]
MRYRSTPFQFVLAFAPAVLGQVLIYSREEATCVSSNNTVFDIFGYTPTVNVQPNCDNAINAVCSLFSIQAETNYATYTATAPNSNDPEACQVHLVGYGNANNLPTNYTSCVEGFQSITINCMLLGYGKYAEEKLQAGVRGVYIEPPQNVPKAGEEGFVTPTNVTITAPGLLSPGFLVGPPGYFGEVRARIGRVSVLPVVIPV